MAIAFCAPLFAQPNGLGILDWDEKLSYYAAVLKSLIEYGQLPFWNPWQCGGDVLWQNPLVPLLSAVYPLSAVMPLALAMKVDIVLHYWVGFLGMHLLLTEAIGLTFLPLVVYLASVFTLSGAPAIHLAVGHSVFLPAFYLPWLLFFLLRALTGGAIRDALLGGAVLALMIFNAGLHMVSMAVIAVAGIALVAAAARRSWKPIVLAAALGISGFVYSAPKLLPVVQYVTSDQFWDTRGDSPHPDEMSPTMMARAYLDPYQYYGLKGVDDSQTWGWWEYGNYIGAPAALLLLSCFLWMLWHWRDRHAWLGVSLGLTALLLLLWSAGEFSGFAPASLASHVLFFSRFRIPSRFTIAFVLVATAFAGWTLHEVATEGTRDARRLVGLVCVVASLQLLIQNRAQLEHIFSVAPLERGFHPLQGPHELPIDRTASAYTQNSPMLRALMRDTSFFNCYESFQLTHVADADAPLISTSGDATITHVSFTPNRIAFAAIAGRDPATILLNQNYGPGWRSSVGPVRIDRESRQPSVVLAAGQAGRFSFSFTPPGLWLGLLIAGAGVAVSSLVWKRRLG